jgi:polyisoprenoid-binding protein YceI
VLVDYSNARAGIRGEISVRVAALSTGDQDRDEYARDTVLEARKYPEIKFTIDSIMRTTERADTVRGIAIGILNLRGVVKPTTATVTFWNDAAAGGMRVLAKMRIPVQDLWPEYGISKLRLGLGSAGGIWKEVWMGVDLLMKPGI